MLTADRYSLKAFPNPVKSQCAIRYSLPVEGRVAIKLYNASGKLVKTLIDQNKIAGVYSVNIDNYKLKIPNGIYFLKLETPAQNFTQKIVLTQ